jgi:Flp pilus assembly pilin Flp
MKDLVARLWSEENGQDLTEYALLLALLALGAIATVRALATTVKAKNAGVDGARNCDCAVFCLGAQAGLPVLLKRRRTVARTRQGIVIVLRFGLGRRLKPTLLKCGLWSG